ncbi:hypothetical protein [Kluyvera ascorbata]|uniref:hypothetical protein n=1 Tax=Kluyvera ascorbata TaxID=51288 RepID=UPI0039F6DE3F
MKFTGLQSSALPDTSDMVKECVNLGQWMLFKSYEQTVGIVFFLKTGNDIYRLDQRGQVMAPPVTEHLSIDEVFYFTDLPRPSSLSNAVFPGY